MIMMKTMMIKKILNSISIFFMAAVFAIGGFYFGSKNVQEKLMRVSLAENKSETMVELIEVNETQSKTPAQTEKASTSAPAAQKINPATTAS